ncbi:DUF3139 domain-containing protein [Paenisporosarcina sp. OV554]|uniref:DUF3139 domain-containing protein n=1 Tax=Paenisporosarcina sp. OV554 TaxID=2135694 RepID=UPI0013047F84|nr:DUF3139 domain-containing protein [Paenisporosarcina sp. OV554]
MSRRLVILVAVILLSVTIYFVNKAAQIIKIEEQVHAHLLEEGYTESDIYKLEGYRNYTGSGVSPYHAIVYFTDEPKADYNYTRDVGTGEINQSSWYGDGKHKEKQ